MSKLKNEQDVLDMLKVKDFRSINKSQIIEFVSSIPSMSKETAIKCIEQFPEFAKNGTIIFNTLKESCDSLLSDSSDKTSITIKNYEKIIDAQLKRLSSENLSEDDKDKIIFNAVDIAGKIDEIRKDHDIFLKNALNKLAGFGGFIVVGGLAILGIKVVKK